MNTVSVKLPPTLANALTAAARSRGISKSELIRSAIREYLPRLEKPVRGSVLDAAGDLVGCLEGPPDLSSNKKYLRGFGG
ncbi:MAG: CopG family transcriptional regulator [Acidobacteriota bacterium]